MSNEKGNTSKRERLENKLAEVLAKVTETKRLRTIREQRAAGLGHFEHVVEILAFNLNELAEAEVAAAKKVAEAAEARVAVEAAKNPDGSTNFMDLLF